MHYKSGERTFIVDTIEFRNLEAKDYIEAIDKETKVKLNLPKHVILNFKYIFSWDRYIEERDNNKVLSVLKEELNRLLLLNPQPNILIGIKHMKKFIEELS